MLRALDSSSSTMPMGLGQQAPVCTEPASSSVDWRVEHLLRGLRESLTPCLTRHIVTGCETSGVCVRPEAWWEMGIGQKGLKRGLLGQGAGN